MVFSDVLAPPSTAPLTASACALVSAKPAAVKLPSVSTRLAPSSVVAPVELPVSVPAVMTPLAPSVIEPAEASVVVVPFTDPLIARLPAVVFSDVLAPPSTAPLTASACALVSAKLAAVKLPSVPIWLAPLSVVAPADFPLSVAAVMTPPVPSLIAPAEVSVVVVPFTDPLIARLPAVVFSDVLAPPSTAPLTASACALVSAKPAAVKLPSVSIWLAPLSVVLPVEWPVSVAAWITPEVWLMLRPAPRVTVWPVTLLARTRSELAPVVVRLRSPAPPLADGALVTVRLCALLKAKSPPVVNVPSAPTRLAPFSVVLPVELPVSVPAVMAPPVPSLIAPAETRVVVVPFKAPLMARSPAVVFSDVPVPPSTVPPTTKAFALVSVKPSAVKLPSVSI